MNFNKIKTDHPKAFKALCDWYADRGELVTDDLGRMVLMRDGQYLPFRLRDLYDFFDEKGILIHIYPFKSAQDESHCFQAFLSDGSDRPIFSTRTEAEHLAFKKAFEILEKTL